jgi:ABC-type glycerol-3-phosphate transport system substrate-binding protein
MEGLYTEPFEFYFTEGSNTVTIELRNGPVAIGAIRILPPVSYPPYENYLQQHSGQTAVSGVEILVQAEDTLYKSDTVLYPVYDRSGADTIPNDPTRLKLNTLGGQPWKEPGQYAVWEVPVEKAGLYKIGIRARQNLARGLVSNRRLYINGEVPFAEVGCIEFPFSDQWQFLTLGDGAREFLFYLDEGINEIKLEVVPGRLGDVIAQLEDVSFTLNYLYRKILMITGSDPDAYRDYQLELEVPFLLETFNDAMERVKLNRTEIERMSGQGLMEGAAIMNTLVVQLEGFLKKPATIPVRLSNYQQNISSFADFIYSLKGQSLEIDYMSLYSQEKTTFGMKTGFFNQLLYHIRAFFGSFTTDYTSIGDVSVREEAITVWINRGRDQVQVVKELTDNFFTPVTNIPVNVKLVQQGLIPAILSGRGPDVALFIEGNEIVNYAARNGLVALNNENTYNDVSARFNPQALVPYEYNGGIYAIPISENFPMLFCRTDIFQELGIDVPETWDEFYNALAVIQKNNMSVGVPNVVSGNQMNTNNSIFAMLLYQRGGQYFNDARSRTTFAGADAVEAFKQWTGFYSKYSLPTEYYFYQRFRMGEMPMGIEAYTMFNMLSIAAPEIKGMWRMYPLPGTVTSNGVNKTGVAGGTCAVMLRDVKNKENAWKFIDWFTNTDTQTQYGLQIEALLGPSGRYDTANVDAFERLPWTNDQAHLIKEQWDQIVELPQTPGSYYIDRNLTNAFRRVVYNNKNHRESLLYYTREINAEIQRKRQEFGLE